MELPGADGFEPFRVEDVIEDGGLAAVPGQYFERWAYSVRVIISTRKHSITSPTRMSS